VKDFHEPAPHFRLAVPGAADDDRRLRTTDVPSNLPGDVTSLVGRESEIEQLRRDLDAARTVTLTGPGGCGKTRLAIAAAREFREQPPHGVWFVDLATVGDVARRARHRCGRGCRRLGRALGYEGSDNRAPSPKISPPPNVLMRSFCPRESVIETSTGAVGEQVQLVALLPLCHEDGTGVVALDLERVGDRLHGVDVEAFEEREMLQSSATARRAARRLW